MKKILFATTALVATASVAAADVTFSGYGRFGVKYTGSVAKVAAVAGAVSKADVVEATRINGASALTGFDTNATDTPVATAKADIDALTQLIDGTPAVVNTQVAGAAAVVQTAAVKGLAQKAADARLASDEAYALTGVRDTVAVTGLETKAAAAEKLLADAQALLAAISSTPEVAAIASDTLITSRMDININASTETDSGVTFGAVVRIRSDEGATTGGINAARFYAKSGGLEVGVGNIWGAMDSMPGAYGQSMGLTGLGYAGLVTNSEMSYGSGASATKEAAEVMYSMGDFSAHISTDGTDTEAFAAFSAGGFTVALATSDSDAATSTETAATVSGKIGGVTVGAAWAETVANTAQYTLSAAMSVGAATTVKAYYNDNEANTVDDASYGLGFVHDLGAGTSLQGGVVSVNDRTMADFGVKFNF